MPATQLFDKPIRFLLIAVLLVVILYFGRGVIIPICLAALLAMLLKPLCERLEKRTGRVIAALLCVLILVVAGSTIVFLLTWQMSDIARSLPNMEERIIEFYREFSESISSRFGVDEAQQKKWLRELQASTSKLAGAATAFLSSLFSVLVNAMLVLVYIFLFLYFRRHLKAFILKLVPEAGKNKAMEAIRESGLVAQRYLTGLAMMIAMLWVLYGIGFSAIGVKYALFFAVLCGLLEIVPFVGNLTGTALTVVGALVNGGDGTMVISIIAVYAVVQFVQTYILEPLIVGAEVNINPLITILVIVLGESLWGIGGMILAIPLTGIVKIVCDHVEPLKPYGFLIGQEKKKKAGLVERLKQRWRRSKQQ